MERVEFDGGRWMDKGFIGNTRIGDVQNCWLRGRICE